MKINQLRQGKIFSRILIFVLTLGAVAFFATCSDGIGFLPSPDRSTTGGTTGTGTTTGSTSGGTDTTTGGGTSGGTNGGTTGGVVIKSVNLVVNEIPRGTASRPYYALFNVATSDPGVTADNYYFALKDESAPKPTASEIVNGTHYIRNVSNTPINIYAWGAVNTAFANPSDGNSAIALALRPATHYALYAMPNGGTDADVVRINPVGLSGFVTGTRPAFVPTTGIPDDSAMFSYVYSVRKEESIVVMATVDNSITPAMVTTFFGAASTTVKPAAPTTTFLPLQGTTSTIAYTYSPTTTGTPPVGQDATTSYLIALGPISSAGDFMFTLNGTDYWFKSTKNF